METRRGLSLGLAVGLMLWSATILAQGQPAGCDQPQTPQAVKGQVVKVDPEQGKVTLRGSDGKMYEFHASKETLDDLKPGKSIEAKLRSPECK